VRTTALITAVLGGAALVIGLAVTPASAATPASAPAAHGAFAPFHGALAHSKPRIGGNFNQDGGNWSGYVARGSGFTSVTASWNEPTVTCNSSNDLYAPWVGIDGYGSSSVEQTGVATDCSSGRPFYQAWYEMYPANPVYYTNAVSGGDSFTGTVTRSGTSYTLTITDNTKSWTKTTTKTYRGSNASAEFILESPTAAYPRFGTVTFTGAKINGSSLSTFSPTALDASNSGGFEDHTSTISGGTTFSVTYSRE
jgi:Peptidase A4 family